MINFLSFLLAILIALNLIWMVAVPIALLVDNRYWIGVLEDTLGKADTNGILVRNVLCVWFWPIALVMSLPKIIKWMRQPR